MPAFRTYDQLRSADVVVVGGGTVGAWTAVLLAESGVEQVVLLEAATLGDGASSRAAGMVRAQGGTETAIRLGLRTQEFYARQRRPLPARLRLRRAGLSDAVLHRRRGAAGPRPHRAAAAARARRASGWSGADVDDRDTGLAPGVTLGASYAPGDGYIDAPRNVLAYTAALTAHGVDVRERCAFTGLRTEGGRVVGVDTSDGPDRHRTRRAHRRPEARRGRRRGGRADPGGRRAPPGGRHRAGPGVRRARSADGVRRDVRNLLAARRSRRPAVGHEQPRRGAGRGRRVRRRSTTSKARDRIEELLPGVQGPRPAPDVGGDHRLHPRPPADPRPAAHRRRPGRRAPWWPAPRATA